MTMLANEEQYKMKYQLNFLMNILQKLLQAVIRNREVFWMELFALKSKAGRWLLSWKLKFC